MGDIPNSVVDYFNSLPSWQQVNLKLFRKSINLEIPSVTEQIKWNVPVFLCQSKALFAMAAFKDHTKFNFLLNGARIGDPHELFNNGLDSPRSRSIDLKEGQNIDDIALRELIREAYRNM